MNASTERLDRSRLGLTLVELMVVVTILALLLGVVLPLAQPAMKGREVREASRMINSFMARAAAEAAATGREVGVEFIRAGETDDVLRNRSYQMAIVKSRPPFTGVDSASRVIVGSTTNPSNPNVRIYFVAFGSVVPTAAGLSFSADADSLNVLGRRMNIGDPFRIKLNYKGHNLDCQRDADTARFITGPGGYNQIPADSIFIVQTGLQHRAALNALNTLPNLTGRGNLPYQVETTPKRSIAAPIDLPTGVYIDMASSGFGVPTDVDNDDVFESNINALRSHLAPGNQAGQYAPTPRTIVMFHPEGGISRFYGYIDNDDISDTTLDTTKFYSGFPPSNLALLIARGQGSEEDNKDNLMADAGSMWATINSRTGVVRTTQNLGYYQPANGSNVTFGNKLYASRKSAFEVEGR